MIVQELGTGQIIAGCYRTRILRCIHRTIQKRLDLIGWCLQLTLALRSLQEQFAASDISLGQIHEYIIRLQEILLHKEDAGFLMPVNRVRLDAIRLLRLFQRLVVSPRLERRIALIHQFLTDQL